MSFMKRILDALVEPAEGAVEDGSALARVSWERDALKNELELMRDEYEVLKRNVVTLIEAQRELQECTVRLFEENKALKQIGHINAIFKSGGLKQ